MSDSKDVDWTVWSKQPRSAGNFSVTKTMPNGEFHLFSSGSGDNIFYHAKYHSKILHGIVTKNERMVTVACITHGRCGGLGAAKSMMLKQCKDFYKRINK